MARPLQQASLLVAGAGYPNADGSHRGFEVLVCKPGDPVELRPEPTNRHDANAIAVLSGRGVQIGYLTAERAPRIGQLIRQGREVTAIFQGRSEWGPWIRVAFDGEQPMLPPRSSCERSAEPEGEWVPDEEWPED